MKVERNFHRPEVVRRLETMDEERLARMLETTTVDEAELHEWQKTGIMIAIAEMDSGKGIPHAEIVRLTRGCQSIPSTGSM